jgi:hypothetical protein
MTHVYKAPNGRRCVINEGAKPANPHTLIQDTDLKLKHSHLDLGEQALLSRDDQKLKAEHVVINYVGPSDEVLGSEEVRRDSLTPITETA